MKKFYAPNNDPIYLAEYRDSELFTIWQSDDIDDIELGKRDSDFRIGIGLTEIDGNKRGIISFYLSWIVVQFMISSTGVYCRYKFGQNNWTDFKSIM